MIGIDDVLVLPGLAHSLDIDTIAVRSYLIEHSDGWLDRELARHLDFPPGGMGALTPAFVPEVAQARIALELGDWVLQRCGLGARGFVAVAAKLEGTWDTDKGSVLQYVKVLIHRPGRSTGKMVRAAVLSGGGGPRLLLRASTMGTVPEDHIMLIQAAKR